MRRWGGDRLAIRQVRYTLAIACVLGVALSLLHLLQDYVQERRHIERAGQGVLALIGPPAARAAFTLDPELAATVVRSALQVQFVARAEIVDTLGRSLAEGSRARETRNLRWLTDRLFGQHLSYRLVFDREGGALGDPEFAARSLGTLVIEFDTRILGQDFLSRSWLLLASGIAWIIILGLVLAVVTHLMITRPLVRLVGAVEQMALFGKGVN